MSGLPRNFFDCLGIIAENASGRLLREIEPLTKSPIETAFAVAFVMTARLYDLATEVVKADEIIPEQKPGHRFFLAPQRKIDRYTVDFFAGEWFRGHSYGVVVECDGHDFHERTKEQAAHDRQRDRFMQGEGYRVLRFTGSEIHRDAFECASEAIVQIMQLRKEQQ